MRKPISCLLSILFAVFFISGLTDNAQALEEIKKAKTVKNVYKVENLVQVADNVIILFDTSESMSAPYGDGGMTKLQAAKQLLKERTTYLPDSIPGLNVGLYTYTPPANVKPGEKYYEFYPLQPFNKQGYQQAVDKLPDEASGPTLMVSGLRRLSNIMEGLTGRTVVFLFTDGSHSDQGATESPLDLAKKIAQKHDISFQIISSTDIETQLKVMEAVASINESSRVFPLESLLGRPEVFTGAVFAIEESYVVTAKTVDEIVGFKLDSILFGFDNSEIDVEFTEELQAVGEVMRQNPDSYIVLAGHTDSQGPEEYNLGLSHRRVDAVADHLAEKFAIDRERITTFWYGEWAPVASNDTEEGRQQNRRVVGFIAGVN